MARNRIVHIEGLQDLQKTLAETMPREARNILRRTVVNLARGVRDDMREEAPKDDGTLRRAIRSRRGKGGFEEEVAHVWITHGSGQKNDAWYWHIVEFGSTKTREHPYIRPVVKVWASKLDREFRTHFGEEFEKEMAKRAQQRGRT